MKHKPKDIAKLLGTTVEEMLSDVDKTSSASLSELAKKNPKKYKEYYDLQFDSSKQVR